MNSSIMEGDRQQEIPGTSSTGGNNLQIVASRPNLPPGYRFIPMDYELMFYLHNKINNVRILFDEIKEVDIYKNDPQKLSEMYPPLGEKEWYFFTSRNRKYPNGSRPDRTVGCGYWKATGADKKVYYEGEIVGLKKILVFFLGKHQDSVKTNWIMHEYRVINEDPSSKRDKNDMKLDDWVLCKIYKKASGSKMKGNQQEDHESSPNSQVEQVTYTKIQTVDNNEEDLAALLVNHNNVAIATTSSSVDNDNGNGNCAAFATPNMQDDELWSLINFVDYGPPPLVDVLNIPNPSLTNVDFQQVPGYYGPSTTTFGDSFDIFSDRVANINPNCNQLMPKKRRC